MDDHLSGDHWNLHRHRNLGGWIDERFLRSRRGVGPIANGMATVLIGCRASFISMAGIIAFAGYDGSVYLMGWTWLCTIDPHACTLLEEVWEVYCARFYWG